MHGYNIGCIMFFFKYMVVFSHLADRMGTRYLQKLLNKELKTIIERHLPEMRADLEKNKIMAEDSLRALSAQDKPQTTVHEYRMHSCHSFKVVNCVYMHVIL